MIYQIIENMGINVVTPFITGALIFFLIMFPIFCLLKTLITVGYMNVANNFKFVLKTMVGINAISSIFCIFLMELANIILYFGSRRISPYYSPVTLLLYYKLVVVVCIYLLTVLLEWIYVKKMLDRLKLSPRKLLTSSFIGNVATYAFAVPIYFLFFIY